MDMSSHVQCCGEDNESVVRSEADTSCYFFAASPCHPCSPPTSPSVRALSGGFSLNLADSPTPSSSTSSIPSCPSSALRNRSASSGSVASFSDWNNGSPSSSVSPSSPMSSAPGTPTLWRPGSTSSPLVKQVLDPLAIKQELQRLYDQLSESSYDLSLRDLVHPSYSISGEYIAGNVKDTASDAEERVAVGNLTRQSKDSAPRRRLSVSVVSPVKIVTRRSLEKIPTKFSLPGIALWTNRRKQGARSLMGTPMKSTVLEATVRARRNSFASSTFSGPRDSSPLSPYDSAKESSRPRRSCFRVDIHREVVDCQQRGLITSKLPLTNQCSSCSSYTIFFKTCCTVCGRFYCCNCAKDYLDIMQEGRKCKVTCISRSVSRRHIDKAGRTCWPFCINIEAENIHVNHFDNNL